MFQQRYEFKLINGMIFAYYIIINDINADEY